MLGSRVPVALKVLLTSIAVIDDLAAIIIIAVFYTDQLSVASLVWAFAALVGLFTLNKSGIKSAAPYVLVGIVLWIAVLKSGVHATLAGVALAAFIPTGRDAKDKTGLTCLCGIGFTMSLFIGSLAFEGSGGSDYKVDDRIGILVGSLLSAIVGVILLRKSCSGKKAHPEKDALDGGLLGPHGKGNKPTVS